MRDGFSNSYILKATKVLVFFSILIFIFIDNPRSYILGLLFGGSITMLLFKLMFLTIQKTVEKSYDEAKRYAIFNYSVRYAIYALVLIIAAKADYINFAATAMSLFVMKVVILGSNFVDYIKTKGN